MMNLLAKKNDFNLASLLQGERSWMIALTQVAAYLNQELEGLNWCGFYLLHPQKKKLVLAPFQGKIACTEIPLDKGVCGQAMREKKLLSIDDVHLFDGHIACDSASASELVIPLALKGEYFAVLDLDSPYKAHFNNDEENRLLEKLVLEALKASALKLDDLQKAILHLYP